MPQYNFKQSASNSIVISGAVVTTGVSDVLDVPNEPIAYSAQLDITAAATEAGDSLALWLQTSYDGGTRWHDVGRFAAVLGNVAVPHTRRMEWTAGQVTTAEEAVQAKAVAAATVRNGPCGPKFRLAWTITQAATTGNESWTCTAILTTVE